MYQVSTKRKIHSSVQEVQAFLWDIANWSRFWFPLHKVEIFYDDGLHQDFSMSLDWNKENASVRTVRFLDSKGNIVFFSPKPPSPMSIHWGTWQLREEDDQSVELTAIRWFDLPFVGKENKEEHRKRAESFSNEFVERLENLLKCLGDSCIKK